MKNAQPIVWAIDPYARDERAWQRSKELAVRTASALKLALQPVYVADRSRLPVLDAYREGEVERFVSNSKQRLARLVDALPGKPARAPQVLFSNEYDTSAEVRRLSEYALARGTPVILASTSARRGLKRFFEGSFAETLIERSRVPILLVNPSCAPIRRLERITFATDFSPLSRRAFVKVCALARAAKARIVIVSVLPNPMLWADTAVPLAPGMGAGYLGTDWLARETKRTQRRGQSYVERAKKLGVRASFAVEERPLHTVARSILAQAKTAGSDLIALATRGDTSKSHLFGSTAQDVIRTSPMPVWIYHADRAATGRRPKKQTKK